MNEKINKLIPLAISAIKTSRMAKDSGIVPKEFKGYISSMGASIIQTGLLPTLAFYQNDDGKKADSSLLLKAIFILIKKENTPEDNLITYVINQTKKQEAGRIFGINDLVMDKLYLIEEDITDALIALKLALRTFKLSE